MTGAELELHAVTKAFGAFVAVRDVTLSVEKGEIRCVIGPNGAGKTTLFNLVAGELRAMHGRILFEGRDITRLSVETRARRGIARSFQTPRLCERLTVFENVRLAVQVAAQSFNPLRRRGARTLVAGAWEVLERTNLAGRAQEPVSALAHGERAWLQLAMIAARPSKLVLLDEPSAGMSDHDIARITEFLKDFRRGRTIVLVEHDLDFVKNIADRITVLDGGQHVMTASPCEIEANEEVRAAYLAVSHAEGMLA